MPYTIPIATARPLNDSASVLLIDTDCIEQVFPRAVAETLANAWNAAAAVCRPTRAEHDVTLHRTMVLAGHEADVTLVVSFNVFAGDVTIGDVRVYDDSDTTSVPLILPAAIRDALLNDDEIYDKARHAAAAMREAAE